jgi:hypothetical protein
MKYIFAIISVIIFCPAILFAQTDSTKTQYSEEAAAASDFNLKETYNYLIRAQVEEKSLLKIGVHGFGLSHNGGYFKYGIGYEQKIKPAFSVLAEVQHTLENKNPIHDNPKYSLNVGARYYYNIAKRIRKGKSANNFSANYLSIYQQNGFLKVNDDFQYQSTLNFLYGIQRRIGKYGYVDFGVGPAWEHTSKTSNLTLNLLFSIGFAF